MWNIFSSAILFLFYSLFRPSLSYYPHPLHRVDLTNLVFFKKFMSAVSLRRLETIASNSLHSRSPHAADPIIKLQSRYCYFPFCSRAFFQSIATTALKNKTPLHYLLQILCLDHFPQFHDTTRVAQHMIIYYKTMCQKFIEQIYLLIISKSFSHFNNKMINCN